MLQLDEIHKFLDKKHIALVGVSRRGDIPSNDIYKKFKSAGYTMYPINPNMETFLGDTCYPNLQAIPTKPEAVFLASSPQVSESVVEECARIGIDKVWMHRGIGKGSYSEKATQFCNDHGIAAITNGCPFMFIEPVDGFHKTLRWFKKF